MKKIGRYDIEGIIGEGGMGIVYKGFDPNFEIPVAIKTLSPQLAADPDFRQRFFGEARKTRILPHPNIVIVSDLGEDDGLPFLVMEFLEGEDLKGFITAQKWMSLEQKLRVMLE